jgi:site-specific recombinase XerD
MQQNLLLTTHQAADFLCINENTLTTLAITGQIPHTRLPSNSGDGSQLRFNTVDITSWLNVGPIFDMNEKANIERLKRQVQKKYSKALERLHEFDKQFTTPRKPKGYSLHTVSNKKLGVVYYVRYIENGTVVPTRWSTHTNNEEAAKEFAAANRDTLLAEYHQRKSKQNNSGTLYTLMRRYYEKDSPYVKQDALRGRTLEENTRKTYQNAMTNHWIPFLKKNRIKTIEEIDAPLLAKFQDHCLNKGNKPQTVNHYISYLRNIFDYLLIRGRIKSNPCTGLAALRVSEGSYRARGCYNINDLKGVFNKRWHDELSHLLCMVIYSTGMRNSEMDRIRVRDIIKINNCRFIQLTKSKTRFGVRLVPLHDFVYGKLRRYIAAHGKGLEDLVFCQANGKPVSRNRYTDANLALGTFTHHDKERLKKEHITFYSGRHFWKTLMNAHDLGEVEEYFMGHKVSQDVAKRYNHRDKQGQEKIMAKAAEVFAILDRKLFTSR